MAFNLPETLVGREKSDTSSKRGVTSRVGEVDLTALQSAKEKYSTLAFNNAKSWDQNVLPSYFKRIQYWDSFIKAEAEKNKQRIDKVLKINSLKGNANGNPTVLPENSPERHIYMLMEKSYGKNNLLNSFNEAAKNAAKDAIAKNVEKTGIFDKLTSDITNLVVTEARKNLQMVSTAFGSAENDLINALGSHIDDKLSPMLNGVKDFYNGARNFLMDKLEAGLSYLTSGAKELMGLTPEKASTFLQGEAQAAIAKVDLLAGYPRQVDPNPTKAAGKNKDDIAYIVNPLEDRAITPENITLVKQKLQEEATSIINHFYDVIGTGMFDASRTQDTNDYIVMSLMEDAKNRIHVFNYVTDLLGYNETSKGIMDAATSFKPSNLIKGILYNGNWDNQTTAAQNVIGSVQRLMSFNDPDNMTTFIKNVGKSLLNLNDNTTEDEIISTLMDKNIKSKPYDPYLVKADNQESTKTLKNVLGSVAEGFIKATVSNNDPITVDVPGRGKNLVPTNANNAEIDKLYKEICTLFFINEKNNTWDANTLSPDPLWGDMRVPAKDGRMDIYGLGSLVRSFRVNKYIPSGEVDYFQNGYAHIFFVKPDLNLTQNVVAAMDMTGNPMMGDIIYNLNYDSRDLMPYWNGFPDPAANYSRTNSYVSYLLSNMLENLPVTDITLDTKDAYENMKGFRMPYGLTHYKNTWGGDITLTFKDTKTLLINNIIQTWVKYISVMKEGIAECAPKRHNYGYLDYAGAIYGFITEPDGQSITHWFRYTGVFPTSVPFSSISTARGNQDIPEFSVNFKYVVYESNDMNILKDFNYIMNNGQLAIKTETSDDLETYVSLGSIPEIKAYTPLSDMTLKTGVFPNENHAYVGVLYPDALNGGDSEIHGMSYTTMESNAYRFILKYDSTEYFQGSLTGEREQNDTIDIKTGFGADAAKVNIEKINNQYTYDSGINSGNNSSSEAPVPFL